MNFRTIIRTYAGLTWSHLVHVIKKQSLQERNKHVGLLSSCSWVRWLTAQTSTAPPLNTPFHRSVPSSANEENPETRNIRGVGRNEDEQISRLLLPPDQPADAKILRVAIIGLPNSGKSTLTNRLLGWRVSSVSKKVHTTRKTTSGILTDGNIQMVFLDTPGIVDSSSRKRHNLEKAMITDPEKSLQNAHLVVVLVDASNRWTCGQLDPLVLQLLHLHKDKRAVLVLNKVDLLGDKKVLLQLTRVLTQGIIDGQPLQTKTKKKSKAGDTLDFNALFDAMETKSSHLGGNLLKQPESVNQKQDVLHEESRTRNPSINPDPVPTTASNTKVQEKRQTQMCTEHMEWVDYFSKVQQARKAVLNLKGWPHFSRIFMVSALSGDGISELKDFLMECAEPGNWDFHSSLVTTQDPKEVVLMCLREKLLEYLKEEIPYVLGLDMELWEIDEDGMLNIVINIIASNSRQVSYLLGPKGHLIKKISAEAKQEMMNTFRCEMRLKLVAKVRRK